MIANLAQHAVDTASSTSRLTTIILTLGAEGVLVYDCEEAKYNHMPAEPVPSETIQNVMGAGDCFMAGYIASLCQGKPIQQCINVG